MDATLTIEPFGFFTLESLRAGWYMIWRQLVRIVPLIIGALAVGGALSKLGMTVLGILIMTVGVVAAVIWGAVLVPQLTSRWAEARYGYSLTSPGSVWWGVTWRVWVASLVAAVIFTPPNFVALSLSTAFANGALGMLGQLLATLLGVANFAVTVLATGWAMSRVTAFQLSGMPVPSAPFVPAPSVIEPVAVAPTVIEPVHAAVSFRPEPVAAATAVAPPVALQAPAPPSAPAGAGKQCPKCGLYETERGTVIGWYCRICGWRESPRR
jgi:hypothetical protein